MKRTVAVVMSMILLLAGLTVTTTSVAFAGNTEDSGVTYQVDSVGPLPNSAFNVERFFGKGTHCERIPIDGGMTIVHPKYAAVVKAPGPSYEVTQPAAPDWYYYTGDGKAWLAFKCEDWTPAPPAPHYEVYGKIVGPYRYTHYACEFNNSHSNRPVEMTCRSMAVVDGKNEPRSITMTVPPHQICRTDFFHVRQNSKMWMYSHTTDEKIVQGRSVPDREWRGRLPKDWVAGCGYE